jgi:hypothetical protein
MPRSNVTESGKIMTVIYFDESHHEKGDFALGAFVVSTSDLSVDVEAAMIAVGFIPGQDEYKSRGPHAADERLRELRTRLFRLAAGSKIGLLIAPFAERSHLGPRVLAALGHIVRENTLHEATAYLDQGLFRSANEVAHLLKATDLPTGVHVVAECDSRAVLGIQVADLVAHACSIALLGRMGVSDKLINDEEEGEYRLSFEMWARLRHNFFISTPTEPERQEAAQAGMLDSRGGLYIAPTCTSLVREMADDRFGQTWLGCIH